MKIRKFYMDILGIEYKISNIDGVYPPSGGLCSTIALMNATKKTFNQVYAEQFVLGLKYHTRLNHIDVLKVMMEENGFEKFNHLKYYTVGEFMYNFKKGDYIIGSSNHIEYYSNGTRYLVPLPNDKKSITLDTFLTERLIVVYKRKEE